MFLGANDSAVYAEDELDVSAGDVIIDEDVVQDDAEVGAFANVSLFVNEVCADEDENGALHKKDPKGEYYDWVEIYNAGNEAVNVHSYYLTDDDSDLTKFQLPDYPIPSKGFLIIYCGKPADEFISGFGISKKGKDTVYLTDGSSIVDSLKPGPATTNMTYSRYPDGGDLITETTATPGKKNTYTIAAPVLSKPSGFYDPFELEMTSDLEIHYTTDGSQPTAKSKKYTGPIAIKDASVNKNVYSARTDVATVMQYSLLKKYKKTKWYQKPPAKKVDKGTRIKAVAVGPDGKVSNTVSAIYFVGLKDKAKYKDIPIVSLQASDADLFSYDKGIYVMGKAFAKYKKNVLSKKTASTCRYPQFWTSNYHSERRINMSLEYFEDVNAESVVDQTQTKLKGHISLGYPQKSWNVKGNEFSITLEAGGSDTVYKLKDTTASALSQNMDLDVTSAKICHVFLNGEYWGVYYIGDRMSSQKYYAKKYGVDKDSVAIIKENKLNEGTKKDLSDYNAMMKFVKSHDMRVGSNYKYFTDRVNVSSLIDYYCAEMYSANTDWRLNKNYAVWRSTDKDSDYVKKYGSKWSYILYDINVGRTYTEPGYNMVNFTLKGNAFFRSLYKNADFRDQFNARFNELLAGDLSPKNAKAALDSVYKRSRPYMSSNFERYYTGKYSIKNYDTRYAKMAKFMSSRAGVMKKHLAAASKNKNYTATNISKFKVTVSGNCTYNGSEQKPKVVVKTNKKTVLKEGTDYTLTYSNNINPGTAKVTVKFKGGFRGTKTKTFKIKKK